MKTVEIVANLKVEDENGNTISTVQAKANYLEPESSKEFEASFDEEFKMRVIRYGLNTIRQSELRAENNFGPMVKMLVDKGFCSNRKEAYDHLIALRNARKAA